jgi:hypothetical protein
MSIKIYLTNHFSAEALTTGRMIPSATNSPREEVSLKEPQSINLDSVGIV